MSIDKYSDIEYNYCILYMGVIQMGKRKQVLAFLLTVACFILLTAPMEMFVHAGSFIPRLNPPAKEGYYGVGTSMNPYQVNTDLGGGNCTWYAWGRAYEILGSRPNINTSGNACTWYPNNMNSGAYAFGDTPKLGAIACWTGTGQYSAGHVAVVEEIYDNGFVRVSESAWSAKDWYFRTREMRSDGQYGSFIFQGYIYLIDSDPTPQPVSVPEGVYVFHCVRDTNMVLDIQYDSKERGANIQLYENLYNQVQKFRVVNMGDYYCIQSVYSGMSLDIASPYNVQGCNIQLWNTNTSKEQKWVFEDAGNGNVYIHSLYGEYLDTGGQVTNSTNIRTWDFDGSTSQQWKLELTSPYDRKEVEDGVYVFHIARNRNRVLDIQWDSLKKGANIQLYDPLYNQEQKFRVVKTGNYYNIQSVYSGMWLDISYPYNQDSCNIQLWDTNTSTEQKWVFEDAGDGKVAIRSLYGMYVDTGLGGPTGLNANVQTWHFDGSTSQQWILERVSPYERANIEDGVYTFHSVPDPSKVISIEDASQEVRANIQLSDDQNNDVQQFRITKIEQPVTETVSYYYYNIQSVYSGHWLDIASPTNTEGCNIQLYNNNTFPEEKWVFEAAGNGKYLIRSINGIYADIEDGEANDNTNIQTAFYSDSASMQWTLHRVFGVTYDANEGSGAPASQFKQENIALTLSAEQPNKTGYTFNGWNTKADGSGTAFACAGAYSDNADLTLYAQWTPASYTVTLDPDGGACGVPAITVFTGEKYGVLPVAVREGYTFDGWFLPDGTQITEDSPVTVLADHTLTAHWTQIFVAPTLEAASTAVLDAERGFLYGLDFGVTEEALREQYLTVSGDGTLEILSDGVIGTGTVIRLINGQTGEVDAEYTVVIFGDINGDGMLTSADITAIRNINARLATYDADSAYIFAADVTHDGDVNSSDVTAIRSTNARMSVIDQTAAL